MDDRFSQEQDPSLLDELMGTPRPVEALTDVKLCFGKFFSKGKSRVLVDYVVDPRNDVCGSASEWWNVIVRYLTVGDYRSALRLARHAMQTYPYSVDLISAALRSSAEVSERAEFDGYVARAESIARRYWTSRLYENLVRSHMSLFDRVEPAEQDAVHAAAVKYSEEFMEAFPGEELAFQLRAQLYMLANDREGARRVIEDAVNASGDESGSLCAAGCCVFMIDELLDPVKDRAEIVRYARIGIRDLCQEQPGSRRLGYLLYREAEALDAQISHLAAKKDSYSGINLTDIENTLTLYQAAYEAVDDPDYLETITSRARLLWRLGNTKERDIPLPEFLRKGKGASDDEG